MFQYGKFQLDDGNFRWFEHVANQTFEKNGKKFAKKQTNFEKSRFFQWSKANRAKLETLEKYMNPSKNFCIYRSIVKAAMQRAEKHQWQSGMVNDRVCSS